MRRESFWRLVSNVNALGLFALVCFAPCMGVTRIFADWGWSVTVAAIFGLVIVLIGLPEAWADRNRRADDSGD